MLPTREAEAARRDEVLDDDAVFEHRDLGVAGALVRRFGADLVAHDHHPLDRFAAGQEFGFGQDRRAAASGITPVAAALPLGLQPGRAVDALDLVACGVGLVLGSRAPARAPRCSAGRPATGCRRCHRRSRTCGDGGDGDAWWRRRRTVVVVGGVGVVRVVVGVVVVRVVAVVVGLVRSSPSSSPSRRLRSARHGRGPGRGARGAAAGWPDGRACSSSAVDRRRIVVVVVVVIVVVSRRSRGGSGSIDRLGRDEQRHVFAAGRQAGSPASAGTRVPPPRRLPRPRSRRRLRRQVAAALRQQVAHPDRVDAVHGGVRAADPAVEFGQRVEHLFAGRPERSRQRMDPQPVRQVLVLRRSSGSSEDGPSSITYSPQAPGRVLSTRPREGFAMGPGHFSRACDGLAPSGSVNTLGAGLNDGWTVGAASRSRWSRLSKSSFGRPSTQAGPATFTRYQYPIPSGPLGPSAADPLQPGEPERDLALSRLRRIGAVHQVELGFQAEIAADGAGSRLLHRVGAARDCRNAATARGPSTIAATSGPDVMNSSSEPKNGLPSCSA